MGILEKLGCRKRKISEKDSDSSVEVIRGDSSSNSGSDPPKSAVPSANGDASPDSDNESFEDEFNRNLAGTEGVEDNLENSLDNFDEMWPSVNDVVNDRISSSAKVQSAKPSANGSLKNTPAGGVKESPQEVVVGVLPEIEQNGMPKKSASGDRKTWSPPGMIE